MATRIETARMTMGQAVVKFLTQQYVERDGVEQPFFAGVWGIFGHGNVAGIGQALEELKLEVAFHRPQNEQGMVHTAAAYAKMKNRLQTFACTSRHGCRAGGQTPPGQRSGDEAAGRGQSAELQQDAGVQDPVRVERALHGRHRRHLFRGAGEAEEAPLGDPDAVFRADRAAVLGHQREHGLVQRARRPAASPSALTCRFPSPRWPQRIARAPSASTAFPRGRRERGARRRSGPRRRACAARLAALTAGLSASRWRHSAARRAVSSATATSSTSPSAAASASTASAVSTST